jgi:hypothetical protein
VDYEYRMYIIPFHLMNGGELLGRFQHVVSKGWFSISSTEHKDLVTQMRIAKLKDNGNLDKGETSNNTYDSIDSARLALKIFEMGERR